MILYLNDEQASLVQELLENEILVAAEMVAGAKGSKDAVAANEQYRDMVSDLFDRLVAEREKQDAARKGDVPNMHTQLSATPINKEWGRE